MFQISPVASVKLVVHFPFLCVNRGAIMFYPRKAGTLYDACLATDASKVPDIRIRICLFGFAAAALHHACHQPRTRKHHRLAHCTIQRAKRRCYILTHPTARGCMFCISPATRHRQLRSSVHLSSPALHIPLLHHRRAQQ